MRLRAPFVQLPLLFDPAPLLAEVAALPAAAWAPHPDRLAGNSAVRLLTPDGAETDGVDGPIRPTRWLAALPGVERLLASIGVAWGRARLMCLAPGAGVPTHVDVAHYWHSRVRVHLPLATAPAVRFACGGIEAHLPAGEAWLLDTWRPHAVANLSSRPRIHLVADTAGTPDFWGLAGEPGPRGTWRRLDAPRAPPLSTEQGRRPPVMPAAELAALVDDFSADLASADGIAAARLGDWLACCVVVWHGLCTAYGDQGRGRTDFARAAEAMRADAGRLGVGVVMRSNGVDACRVLHARILDRLLGRA